MRLHHLIGAIVRFAARDLRTILSGTKVLVVAVAIGVAAVTGVVALTDSFLTGLARDGRTLLGGDLSLARAQEAPSKEELAFLNERGAVTILATTRATIVGANGEAASADIKAVAPDYPLVGAVASTPPVALASLDAAANDARGALADPALLARLKIGVGDALTIGKTRFVVRATLDSEPDRLVGGPAFAPRLIISRDALAATGLVTPEALIRWTVRVVAKGAQDSPATDGQVAQLAADFRARFPQAGYEIRTRGTASPQIERITERVSKFLLVMSLLAVIVGGIGVWNAVAAYAERQRTTVAILKTLGASGTFVFGLTMTELLVLAGLGVVIGAVLGSALPFTLAPFLAGAGLGGFQPIVSAHALGGGAAVGFGAALLFSIVPAGSVHDVPGAALLRGEIAGVQQRVRARYYVGAVVAFVAFLGAVTAVSGDMRFAASVGAGALLLAALFDGTARLLPLAVRRVPRPTWPVGRLAWTSLARTSRAARGAIVSLGIALIILAATAAITTSLRDQLLQGLPDRTPNLFLVGVPAKDGAAFEQFLVQQLPGSAIENAPLMRGRIVEVGGVPAEQVAAKDGAAWVLDGDRGITFARTPPAGATIAAGSWWAPDYDGPPLVSLGADAARGLGLHVGDTLAVNIAGRRLEAKIANLRDINWASFGINFVLVFSPRPIEAAPHSILYTVAAPTLGNPVGNAGFVQALAQTWPTVVAVDIGAMLGQARTLVDKIGLAVEASAIFTIAAGIVVLAGAVAAERRARERTATILKVVGATRGQLAGAALLEFAVLGCAAGALAIVAGNCVAWGILRFGLDVPFVLALGPITVLLVGAVGLVAVFGLVGNWRNLTMPPARVLRRI